MEAAARSLTYFVMEYPFERTFDFAKARGPSHDRSGVVNHCGEKVARVLVAAVEIIAWRHQNLRVATT
jgi:hypothetical protein